MDRTHWRAPRACPSASSHADDDPWASAELLELDSHHGFGWAVKAALESGLVRTRHVLIVQHDKPSTLLAFPRHVLDANYAFAKLGWLCERYGVSEAAFREAHRVVSEPELVHYRRRRRERRRRRARR